jgi:hypothetical protein
MQTAQVMAVQGDFERLIRLNTDLDSASAYFRDLNYLLPRLPEIERVLRYSDGRYRMIFSADDGRGHEMGVVFDIRHEVIENRHIKIHSIPISESDLRNDSRLAHSKGPLFPGRFSGETLLHIRENHIEIIYRVNLHIEIEVPKFLSFMPRKMLQQIGDTLMKVKMHRVGDGLAERLIEDFDEWLEINSVESGRVKMVEPRHQRATSELN